MIILLYTVVPRSDAMASVSEEMTHQMHSLAEATPGFIGAEYFERPDGGTFGVLRFENEAALAAWRDHPDHAKTHQRAVEEVYSTYRVEVCERLREASFSRGFDDARAEQPLG